MITPLCRVEQFRAAVYEMRFTWPYKTLAKCEQPTSYATHQSSCVWVRSNWGKGQLNSVFRIFYDLSETYNCY